MTAASSLLSAVLPTSLSRTNATVIAADQPAPIVQIALAMAMPGFWVEKGGLGGRKHREKWKRFCFSAIKP